MPRTSRAVVMPPDEINTVHCVNRCVRRAFLCGYDAESGRSFEHRREWIQDRLEFLAGAMGIDVMGFSVMSNHVHVVLRNRPDLVKHWSNDDVRRRWWMLCPQRRDEHGAPADPTGEELSFLVPDEQKMKAVRARLSDISWLMRFLCENIARRANKEDDVTGHFWEGRFKGQVLLDESALLACAIYVDLNPIRAGIAATPETSRFTSAYERIGALNEHRAPSVKKVRRCKSQKKSRKPKRKRTRIRDRSAWLSPISLLDDSEHCPTSRTRRASDKGFLPMTLAEYLRLLDWTGRQARRDKRGKIPSDVAPILERLQVAEDMWVETVVNFGRWFRSAVGRAKNIQGEVERRGRNRLHGSTACGRAFV